MVDDGSEWLEIIGIGGVHEGKNRQSGVSGDGDYEILDRSMILFKNYKSLGGYTIK